MTVPAHAIVQRSRAPEVIAGIRRHDGYASGKAIAHQVARANQSVAAAAAFDGRRHAHAGQPADGIKPAPGI
jgi:hypothetical protein